MLHRAIYLKQIFRNSIQFESQLKTIHRSQSYIVLPEIPSDTPETNPLLKDDSIPNFEKISPKKLSTGLLKLSIDFDTELDSFVQNFKSGTAFHDSTFDEFFLPLEKSLTSLEFGYKNARHIAFLAPQSDYMTAFKNSQVLVQMRKNQRWLNQRLYIILKEFESNNHLLSESQKQIIQIYKKSCELNGLNLSKNEFEKLQIINKKISNQNNEFRRRLEHATNKFNLVLNNPSQVAEIPLQILRQIAIDKNSPTTGPWSVTLNDSVIEAFLKYCSNRSLRQRLYEAYYSRASYLSELSLTNNAEIIKNLVSYRKQKAELFGYKNYAQFILETKSVANLENIVDMIESVRYKLKPIVDKNLEDLQAFSKTKGGNIYKIEQWDLEYWKTKKMNDSTRIDRSKINEYLRWDKIQNGIIKLFARFFGIDLIKNESLKSGLWSRDVVAYDVIENGNNISTLLIDPFYRKGKLDTIWCLSGRDSSIKTNKKPIGYLMLNIKDIGKESCIDFNQFQHLFCELGKLLQILIVKTDYSELSDFNNFESDLLPVISKVFERLIYVPEIFNTIINAENKDLQIYSDNLQNMRNVKFHGKSFDIMKQTYLSAFDIECHISSQFWLDIMEELWPKFMPTTLPKDDYHPCQMLSIFGNPFGISSYSEIWSEILAADIFEAFNEVGFDNTEQIHGVFKRFRNSFLEDGNILSTNEKFRRFRGRNPSINPFIKEFCGNNSFIEK